MTGSQSHPGSQDSGERGESWQILSLSLFLFLFLSPSLSNSRLYLSVAVIVGSILGVIILIFFAVVIAAVSIVLVAIHYSKHNILIIKINVFINKLQQILLFVCREKLLP